MTKGKPKYTRKMSQRSVNHNSNKRKDISTDLQNPDSKKVIVTEDKERILEPQPEVHSSAEAHASKQLQANAGESAQGQDSDYNNMTIDPNQVGDGPAPTQHPSFSEQLEFSLSQPSIIARFRDIFNIDKLLNEIKNFSVKYDKIKDTVDKQCSRIDSLEAEVKHLRDFCRAHTKSENDTKKELNELSQYSRRNSLRISNPNWTERPGENTDAMVVEMAQNMGVNSNPWDIDRSHRVGRSTGSQRPVIVKFTGYGPRRALYDAGIAMRKDRQRPVYWRHVYINEDLTPTNNELLFKARVLKRNNKIHAAITRDGRVMVKTHLGSSFSEVKTEAQLNDIISQRKSLRSRKF